jgi:hypothetical protein
MQWALAAVLAACAVTFGCGLTQATRPPANLGLGNWLVRHHLRSGIAEYWAADSLTADTGGAVQILPVQLTGGRLAPNLWETDAPWFDPGSHYANFLIVSAPSGSDPHPMTRLEAIAALGAPWRSYSYQGDVILVWQKNLLTLVSPSARVGLSGLVAEGDDRGLDAVLEPELGRLAIGDRAAPGPVAGARERPTSVSRSGSLGGRGPGLNCG